MVVTVFSVYSISNRLGLRIRLGVLAACAAAALLVDFGAAIVSSAPGRNYFICLFVLAAIFSAAITFVNKRLVRKELAAEEDFAAQVQDAYLGRAEDAEEFAEKKNFSAAVKNISEEKIDEERLPEKIIAVENSDEEKIFDKPATIDEDDEKKSADEENDAPADSEPVKKNNPVKPAEKKILVSEMKTLDEILDYAYTERARGNFSQAAYAYKKALERYGYDDYAPFVAVDLSNVYKEQAFYMKAIKTYETALKLPAVVRNSSIQKEFQDNLNYLRVVQSVLLKNRALSTPFSKISPEHLQEIEAEFQAKRSEFD